MCVVFFWEFKVDFLGIMGIMLVLWYFLNCRNMACLNIVEGLVYFLFNSCRKSWKMSAD